jgi:hypothetical protein
MSNDLRRLSSNAIQRPNRGQALKVAVLERATPAVSNRLRYRPTVRFRQLRLYNKRISTQARRVARCCLWKIASAREQGSNSENISICAHDMDIRFFRC